MVYTDFPVKAELVRAKPDFCVKIKKAWEHKDTVPKVDRLVTWLIWNVDFNLKTRFAYLLQRKGVAAALCELAEKLNKEDYGIYADPNHLMIWKPESSMPVQEEPDGETH